MWHKEITVKCSEIVFSCPFIYKAGLWPRLNEVYHCTSMYMKYTPKAQIHHLSTIPFSFKRWNEIELCSQIPEALVTFLLEMLSLIESLVFS